MAYVTKNEAGSSRITGSRVSLASIVHCFWRGETPEMMLQAFPSLTLEQVYGAIAYYLAHRAEVDAELERIEQIWSEERSAAETQNRELRARLLKARGASATG